MKVNLLKSVFFRPSISRTPFTAVFNRIPVFFPFFSPTKGPATDDTDLLRKMGFFHDSDYIGYSNPMKKEKVHLVWFKRDLRVEDHQPLRRACEAGRVLCFYIYETSLIQSTEWSSSHGGFLNESLDDLRQDLHRLGIRLYRFSGEVIEILNQLKAKFDIEGIWSHQETGNALTYHRDKQVAQWCRDASVPWKEFPQFGVVRPLKSRDGWARSWNEFMSAPIESIPKASKSVSQDLSFEKQHYEFPKERHLLRQKGGIKKAKETLESFLRERGRFYSKQMSSPNSAWEACSRLSPYFSFGNLSMRQAWQATELQRAEGYDETGWKASLSAFASRLRWHCHFIQKLEDEPEIEFENMNRQMNGLRENEFNEKYFEAWKKGETGYPLIDACMRALQKTGWINFRMRAMLVSFSSYHLWLHWRKPALVLANYFLDYEPGIHFSQIQMQSGTTGINSIRIYSPIKQVLDQDPKGEFIKKWVPELETVPIEFIAEPQKMPESLQRKVGCLVGRDYPTPIVEHSLAYADAKKKVFSWRSRKEVKDASKKVFLKHGSRKRRRGA